MRFGVFGLGLGLLFLWVCPAWAGAPIQGTAGQSKSSALWDAVRFERRLHDYAEHYDVTLIDFKTVPIPKSDWVRVRVSAQGDFHDLMALQNRLAIFSMVQRPQLVRLTGQMGEPLKLEFATDYLKFAPPGDLTRVQQNGTQEGILGQLWRIYSEQQREYPDHLSFLELSAKPELIRLRVWCREPGDLERFVSRLTAGQMFSVERQESKDPETVWLNIKPNLEKIFSGKSPKDFGSQFFAAAYNPLGLARPFWKIENTKKSTTDDFTLVQSDLWLGRFFPKALVASRGGTKRWVKPGEILTRFQGRVVKIEKDRLILDESYKTARNRLEKKQTAIGPGNQSNH